MQIIAETLVWSCLIMAPSHFKVRCYVSEELVDSPVVRKGDRIAQLVLERIVTPDVLEVSDLDATQRGAGGFGSTGTGAGPAQSNL